MSEENMSDSYEVGYGKPPKDTQFKKGSSGNPKGRPRKALDFGQELLRQSRAIVTINVNGCRRRVSKHQAATLQLLNQAISGNVPALRTYFDRHQSASEKAALREAAQAKEAERRSDIRNWTDEELEQEIFEAQEFRKKLMKKLNIPNED